MELKLKHLAPYLPYQLNCKWHNKIYILQSVTIADRCKLLDNFNNELYGTKIEHIKPILKPLSDLTKEIEVNGLNYSFEDWVFETSCPSEIDQYNKCIYGKLSDGSEIKKHYLSYRIIEKLFEWHFDIFGLIENNLAIDINTLK